MPMYEYVIEDIGEESVHSRDGLVGLTVTTPNECAEGVWTEVDGTLERFGWFYCRYVKLRSTIPFWKTLREVDDV